MFLVIEQISLVCYIGPLNYYRAIYKKKNDNKFISMKKNSLDSQQFFIVNN